METRIVLACDHVEGLLARKLTNALPEGVRLVVSKSLRDSLERLDELRPEVVVLDPLTAGGGGELQALAARGLRQVPVLMVGDHLAAEALSARGESGGPWDLVDRRAHPGEFRLRVERLLREARRWREVGELRHRASHDDRTDLLRPQAFQEVLLEQFETAARSGSSLVLILVDLDKFGSINKRFDHTVGDAVIERVGAAVRRTLRLEDFAGRLGGDEFAVLLPFAGPAEAERVCERLREGIVRLSGRWTEHGADLTLSGSFGWAVFDGEHPKTVSELRLAAERSLREAKRLGGNGAIGPIELGASSNGSGRNGHTGSNGGA
ncbi:MAG: GGDEF domain-containing protein [Planctomycetota bacterium]